MRYIKLSAFCFLITAIVSCRQNTGGDRQINLVPDRSNTSPDYWCTWGAQNYATDTASVKHSLSLGDHSGTAINLTEKNVFGEYGWSAALPDFLRQDMILLFDLGWDVPAGQQFVNAQWMLGSLMVADDKFPSCTGTPAERLRKLNEMVLENGWKASGLWLPAHPYGDRKDGITMPDDQVRAYYSEGLRISQEAGIKYWKMDYGFRGGDISFREMVTRMMEEQVPGMLIEHSRGSGPLNDEDCPWDTDNVHRTGCYRSWDDGRVLQKAVEVAKISHVLRTYDITQHLSVPTTLDRVAQVLIELSGTNEEVILNCEDEPYIGAVLGCAIGVLRHPGMIELEGWAYDPFTFRRRIDEVTRAVRWHRIAPAFGAGLTENILDPVMLADTWKFEPGDAWATWVTGREIVQRAPARVARGMTLPEVECEGDPPYVICCRYPEGATAVGTLPRISADKKIYNPLANVTIEVENTDHPIGIFGRFQSLTINFPDQPDIKNKKIYGQDLAGTSVVDITGKIKILPGQLVIPGEIISLTGLSAASQGDLSEPGMVMQIIQ